MAYRSVLAFVLALSFLPLQPTLARDLDGDVRCTLTAPCDQAPEYSRSEAPVEQDLAAFRFSLGSRRASHGSSGPVGVDGAARARIEESGIDDEAFSFRDPSGAMPAPDPAFVSAAGTAGGAASEGGRREETHFHLSVSYESWEFAELTSDVVDEFGDKIGEVDIEDVKRELTRFRGRFGHPTVGGYVEFLVEHFNDGLYDMLGVGGGISGIATLHDFGLKQSSIFMEYDANFSFHWGDGDVPLYMDGGQVGTVS